MNTEEHLVPSQKKPQRINRKKAQLQFWEASYLASLGAIQSQDMAGATPSVVQSFPEVSANFAAATAGHSVTARDTFEKNLEAAK